MGQPSLAIEFDHYFWFPSAGGYIFHAVGKTKNGNDVVMARSFRYKSRPSVLLAINLIRGKNTHIPIFGPTKVSK
jgi:uncharacterized protein YegP (UPF0339 family)